jgi:hypothetical protein
MSYADYIGRTVDIALISGDLSRYKPQTLSIADGLAITGIRKLAQRFITRLLTSKESVRFDPEFGSDFMTSLRSGQLRTDYDVKAIFSAAAADIETQLRAEEFASTPVDEQYKSAELVSVTIGAASVSIVVEIISQADNAYKIIVPIKGIV